MSDLEHKCNKLPPSGVVIVRSKGFLESEEWPWCMQIERSATEADLEENHYLESEGETIWSTAIGIAFCPYCGEQLLPQPANSDTLQASYLHFDFGSWSAQKR